jgi:hypothetical protein
MSERKLSVRATYSLQEMLAQLQCNYLDWISEGYNEEEVFGKLRDRVNPLVNGFYRGWSMSDRQRLGIAWRYFEEWRAGQKYIRQRAADASAQALSQRGALRGDIAKIGPAAAETGIEEVDKGNFPQRSGGEEFDDPDAVE